MTIAQTHGYAELGIRVALKPDVFMGAVGLTVLSARVGVADILDHQMFPLAGPVVVEVPVGRPWLMPVGLLVVALLVWSLSFHCRFPFARHLTHQPLSR